MKKLARPGSCSSPIICPGLEFSKAIWTAEELLPWDKLNTTSEGVKNTVGPSILTMNLTSSGD
ncbi:MAG: hypothetical protein BWY13_00311 [Euryarchaeota archaeon ADurb.Bin190]|nr:MAG: hypothetical protein BWY13_00311 [Euryarchaeota archaeon ADurb.Bin190]